MIICLLTWLVFEVLSHTIGRFQRKFNGQSFTYHILPRNNFVAVESVSGKTLPDDFLRISKSQVLPRRMRKTLPATKAPHAKEAKSLRGAVEEQCWDRILWRSWRNHSWLMEWIHWLMEFSYMKKPMRHLTFFIWRSKFCWFLQNGSIWKRLICPCSCRTWCLKSSLRWELLPRIASCGWGSFTRNWCPHTVM